MDDEIRGLSDASAEVIALGTNDAGWVALGPDQAEREQRLTWVRQHLLPMLIELRGNGHCAVVVTLATRNKSYFGTTVPQFEAAASQINGYLRAQADADLADRLMIWDWAARADQHTSSDPVPWFGPDTIHLNGSGIAAYADALANAANECRLS